MPKLLFFAPCQKAIIDKADDSVSLISVLNGITVFPQDKPNEPRPADAVGVAPVPWGAVSVWLRTPGDEDKTFEQKLNIAAPNGAMLDGESSRVSFKMTHRTHQIALNGEGLPVEPSGEYQMILAVREIGQTEWTEAARYPLEIIRSSQKPPADNPAVPAPNA